MENIILKILIKSIKDENSLMSILFRKNVFYVISQKDWCNYLWLYWHLNIFELQLSNFLSLSSQCFQFFSCDHSHISYSECSSSLLCAKTSKTNNISVPLLCTYMLRVHVNINTTYIYHELTFTQHTWVGRISSVSWLGEIWGVGLLCTAYYDLL